MSFANLLFCANLLLCGVNVLSESSESTYFTFFIWKGEERGKEEYLSTEYYFEEGREYIVFCRRYSDWYLHWEVEPYGLKSTIIHDRHYDLVITAMKFVFRRDDQITIGCYTKHNETNKEENKTTTFVWNKILNPLLSTPPRTSISKDVRHDADTHKCYTKNDTETCAYLQVIDSFSCNCAFDLQMYTRINHNKVNGTECYGLCYCTNTNGSSSCECLQGYNKNETGWCEDINECQLNISDCKNGERCWNTDGSFKCCPNDTILDKNGNCVCPDHYIYDQNQGCVYEQRFNTSCGLEPDCRMIYAKGYCFCPNHKGKWYELIPQGVQMDPSAILDAASSRQHAITKATMAGDSRIQEFYRDAVIFITGGSGFIGKQLVEKLFRSCQIKRVYLLMRSRKDKDIQQRLVSMLQDPVFGPLRESQPGFADRISPVAGDIAQLKLGLGDEDWKTITVEVSIIFHVAATVRFDEPLQSAVLLNVRGTREVLRLGRTCAKLRSLVHVSTAYAFATADRIGDEVTDRLYKPPVPPEMLVQMVENMDKEKIDQISTLLISGWPNTYCFTKAAAEDFVRSLGEGLPVCIVRPSIVIEAYTEPLPGWLEESCVFGASGLTLGSILGVIHTIRANQDIYVDFVPVDYVNNVIIAAGWETGKGGGSQAKVYAVTSARKGIQWRDVSTCLNKKARDYISPKASWYGFVWETNNYYLHLFYTIVLHFIPAYVIDGVTSVFGKKSGLVNLYKKVYKMSIVLRYFTNHDWKFRDDNTVELRKNMSETDRIIFNFDITDINVSEWILLWVLGLRKYVVKDGLKGTKYAVKQQKIYYFINCLAVLLICFSLLLFLKVFLG